MSTVTVSSLLGSIEQYKYNPAKMQQAALATLRTLTDGTIDVVDATNPFVFCMETTAVNTAAFMQNNEAIHRRQYPAAATTQEDLYLHMSDKDYINRFALPTNATFTLMFQKDELLNALVLDPLTGIKKVTIPRNTLFSVAGINFSLQYPIDIRILTHGGLQVVYDNTQVSPLQALTTNLVPYSVVYDPSGVGYIQMTIVATQFDIITKLNDVNAASGFSTTIQLTDSFYYIRVYNQLADSSWREIQTTHSQQIYDPAVATAVISVTDTSVTVAIPVIYSTTGLLRNKIRMDVYQTKGSLNMLLGNYKLTDFSATWKTIDAADATVYVTPLQNLKTMVVYSETAVTGGRASLSFAELQSRVIANNVGPQLLPITNVQLQSSLMDAGYEIVKNVDTITNRIFLATKPMPTPVDERLITAAASSVATVLLSFSNMAQAHGVNIHTTGVTLTPSALYQNVNGVTSVVTENAHAALLALTPAQLCATVNASTYLYSPFHYVLDATAPSFDVRPYYMDAPTILSKSFVEENASTGLQVSVDATYLIARTATGYRLTLSTSSSQPYKDLADSEVYAQLSFLASGQTVPAFMLGVQLPRATTTDERVYVFDMATTFNIDTANTLDQTSFTFGPTSLTTRSDLLQNMEVYFATSAQLGVSLAYTALDNALGRYQLPSNTIGITHETLLVRFGSPLPTLWSQGKSVVGSVPYKTHVTDVPRLYPADVYTVDPVTGASFSLDTNGALVYNILHHKNDPVLDSNGLPTYQYRAGDAVLDTLGNPVPQDNYASQMLRQVDVTVIEGAYWFATDSVATTYLAQVTASVVGWLTQDLTALSADLLDQTKIYFYPKVTQGDINVMTLAGVTSKIPAGQGFTVTLHVPSATYNDAVLLAAIKKTTITTIASSITAVTVAVSFIESALRNQYGSDVIDVKLDGLGGLADFNALTVLDQSNRLSLRKRLVTQPDGQLIIEEDINFVVIEHALKTLI